MGVGRRGSHTTLRIASRRPMETTDIEDPQATERLDPVEGVVAILSRAAMTGTHKLGLLLALLDLAPESVKSDRRIAKKCLAARIVEIHWTHGRPYGRKNDTNEDNGVNANAGCPTRLRQSSSRKKRRDGSFAEDATVMLEIAKLRKFLRCQGSQQLGDKPLEVVQRVSEGADWHGEWCDAFKKSVKNIEKDLWRNPVKRLHELSGNSEPFLYELDGRDGIRFLEGVPEVLSRFAGVLRPLIEFSFTERVVKINGIGNGSPQHEVRAHLFGQDRIMPPDSMKSEMRDLQHGRCVLTGDLLGKEVSVDHLIPWSRHRLSNVENLLITTRSVNSRKSDSLPGPDPIKGWMKHVLGNTGAIDDIAQRHSWPTNLGRVLGVALHIYDAADPSTGVWNGRQGVRPLGKVGRERVIEKLRWAEQKVA